MYQFRVFDKYKISFDNCARYFKFWYAILH